MKKRCPTHGVVLHEHRTGEYCPICGEKMLCFNFFPLFKIYLEPDVARFIFYPFFVCLGLCIFIYVFNIRGCIGGCIEDIGKAGRVQEALIQSMPDEWKTLYNLLSAANYDSKLSVVQNFCRQNKNLPPSSPDYIPIFADLANYDTRAEILDLVQSNCQNLKDEQ